MMRLCINVVILVLLQMFFCLDAMADNIVFHVDKIEYSVDDNVRTMDAAPFISEERVYVPVRYLAEALEAEVEYFSQEIQINKNGNIIVLKVGSNKIVDNMGSRFMDVVPLVRNERSYLPAKYIAEAYGYGVMWEGKSKSVMISPSFGKKEVRGEIRQIVVGNVQELIAVEKETVAGNVTVLLKEGEYKLAKGILIAADNVTYCSLSGNREKVILNGDFKATHVFWVQSDNVIIKDLTLGWVNNHGIQVQGERGVDSAVFQNLRIVNCREQMLKGSAGKEEIYSKNCLVENCLFEFSEGKAYQAYTGGIDVHRGKSWIVRDNIFRGIKTEGNDLTEGAVHFWSDSQDTLIENNLIIECDRGIMLGLDNSAHYGGEIRGNKIQTVKDTGIYLANAKGAKIYENTVFVDANYPNAIEYRFPGTEVEIFNNITNKQIKARNLGKAFLDGNILRDIVIKEIMTN